VAAREQQSETTLILLLLMDVTIKHRKDNEESETNQIFKALDILVIVDDGEDLANLAN
jgi:hypothetical protein